MEVKVSSLTKMGDGQSTRFSVHHSVKKAYSSFGTEFQLKVPASRMFKAMFLDSHNLIPKLCPETIKSIEIVQGDGGVGSIKQVNFPEGSRFKYLKYRINALDVEHCKCKYSLIEGDELLGELFESLEYEVKFEENSCAVICDYLMKVNRPLTDEEKGAAKDQVMELHGVVEEYLVAKPDVYA